MRNTRASRTMPTEKQYLYYLIVSQLYNDGHTEAAIQLEMTALQSTGCVKAGDRLNKMLSACVGGFTDVTDFLDEQKSATHKSYTTPPPSSSRKRPLPSSTSDTISSSSVASNILHANTDPNTSPTINVYKCVKLLTNTDLISNDMLSPTTPETASSEAITEPNPPEIPIQDINTDTHIAIGLNDPKEYPKNINLTNPLQSPILDPELIQNIDTTNISNFSNLTKDLEDICKAVADELPLPVNYAELIKPAPEETTVKDEAEVSIKTEQIDPPDLEDSNATLNNLTACIMGSLAQYQDTPGPSVDYTNYIENQKSGMDMLMGYKDGSPISSSSPASLNTTDVMVPVSGEHSNSEGPSDDADYLPSGTPHRTSIYKTPNPFGAYAHKSKPYRRRRTRFNDDQIIAMEQYYNNVSHYARPDNGLPDLIQSTGLSHDTIMLWFQNKRARDKRKVSGWEEGENKDSAQSSFLSQSV